MIAGLFGEDQAIVEVLLSDSLNLCVADNTIVVTSILIENE